MVDRFARLRHDAVVSGHDEHNQVGDFGAAGAHKRKRRVTGRVEENHAATGAHVNVVRANVLGDAAGFAFHDPCLANRVE